MMRIRSRSARRIGGGTRLDRIFGTAPGDLRRRRRGFARPRRRYRSHRQRLSRRGLASLWRRRGRRRGRARRFRRTRRRRRLLVHPSDDPGRDLLEGAEDAAFVGGFAAAAKLLGRAADLVMLDMTDPQRPRARTLSAALARIVRGARDQSALHRRADAPRPARRRRICRNRRSARRLRGNDRCGQQRIVRSAARRLCRRSRPCATFCCAKIPMPLPRLPSGSTTRAAARLLASAPQRRRCRLCGAARRRPRHDCALPQPLRIAAAPAPDFGADADRRRFAGAAACRSAPSRSPHSQSLCAAARQYGNGIIEITARGSIQVRGLSAASAPHFAAAVAALGIAAEDGVPVICQSARRSRSRRNYRRRQRLPQICAARSREPPFAGRLAPKVSVAIDGGGALGLDALAADMRLRAELINGDVALARQRWRRCGKRDSTRPIMPPDGVEAALRLLEVIAQRGRDARARDVLAAGEVAAVSGSTSSCRLVPDLRVLQAREAQDVDAGNARPCRNAIGTHPLRDGSFACGIGLAFGHAEAATLERLTDAAAAAGAHGCAPRRAARSSRSASRSKSRDHVHCRRRTLGFITRADDPRRHVIACAGAPICASAHIAARAIAPRIAEIAAPLSRRLVQDSYFRLRQGLRACRAPRR